MDEMACASPRRFRIKTRRYITRERERHGNITANYSHEGSLGHRRWTFQCELFQCVHGFIEFVARWAAKGARIIG